MNEAAPPAPRPTRVGRWRAFSAGLLAGLVTVAGMYGAAALVGTKPLPQLLQGPILALMPGPVFGFLIDNLQHLGKVVEEASLIVALITVGGIGGLAYALLLERGLRHAALVVAGAAWLVLMLVVLPATGDGLLGLAEGIATPFVWALLAAVYATILQLASAPLDDRVDDGRRRVVGLLPVGLGVASLGVLGFRLVPGWFQSVARPPEATVSGPSPEITPVANFYVVSKNFSDPVVARDSWLLRIHGLVRRELRLRYDELRSRPSSSEFVTFACISNDVGGNLVSTGKFTGVRLRDLLREAQPASSARTVAYTGADGFTESYPLSLVMAEQAILVAYDLDGQPLPDSHGFPARIVLPGHYGMKQPKWLTAIELRTDDPGGFWEQQGWDHNAVVKTMSRFDFPRDGFLVHRGNLQLSGIAFAGTRGIAAVEVSTDGGASWSSAYLKPPLSGFTWTLWSHPWTPPREGVYTLVVRARDGSGRLQESAQSPSFPSGATGYHTIQLTVAH